MIKAIVYTSNAGTTAEYAKLLAGRTGLPCYSLNTDKGELASGTEIIYLGWIMASEIKGYKKAKSRYKVCAVCAIGMGENGTQIKEVRNRTKIPDTVPVFTLQGGFDIKKLSGMYKLMMGIMVKTAGKALAKKEKRTLQEDKLLDMMLHGGNYVCLDQLKEVMEWYNKRI